MNKFFQPFIITIFLSFDNTIFTGNTHILYGTVSFLFQIVIDKGRKISETFIQIISTILIIDLFYFLLSLFGRVVLAEEIQHIMTELPIRSFTKFKFIRLRKIINGYIVYKTNTTQTIYGFVGIILVAFSTKGHS